MGDMQEDGAIMCGDIPPRRPRTPERRFYLLAARLRYKSWVFKIQPVGDHFYLQAAFWAPDCHTGVSELQTTRKWLLSEHMTDSEFFQTALMCVLTAEEHEARESFVILFPNGDARAPFAPHFNVEALAQLPEDARINPEKP